MLISTHYMGGSRAAPTKFGEYRMDNTNRKMVNTHAGGSTSVRPYEISASSAVGKNHSPLEGESQTSRAFCPKADAVGGNSE